MEELKNALAELYLKHGNHEIIVDLSQILDRYIVEKQIEKRNKNQERIEHEKTKEINTQTNASIS